MKRISIILFAVVLSFINTATIQAQTLTDNQKVLLQERVKQKVEEFQYSLSQIVNAQNSHKIRSEHVELLTNLFIGKCEPYKYYDENLGKEVKSKGVKMQTSSVNHSYKSRQLMKDYIYKLYNPETGETELRYSKITIESASAVRVDNIERVGDHYECVAYFCQKFIGYRDGNVVYSDVTSKKVRCYIKSIDTDKNGTTWDAKLGDMYVISTEKS